MTVWLIGGTSESVKIAQLLFTHRVSCVVSVTTPSAVRLYLTSPYLKVRVGKLESDSAAKLFCQQELVQGIIDASHPYAIAISERAIAVAQALSIPYLRYERPLVPFGSTKIIPCASFTNLIKGDYLRDQRVLLTVGCNSLHYFRSWQDRALLFTRILPREQSLALALDAGFTPERIIALRPPLSFDLEVALWRHWGISLVVTKANGIPGGEDIKQKVALALDIPLITISRPNLSYPDITGELDDVLKFCLYLKPIG
ncbi:cobalt-precorrin-6A reductase [Gloeocapsa sp. PCC 73106]|uniref:cobalt-precorrin-6A reductase n=1 Tax=Gloeocapsa sp. PCC 73106 TaxID=102232 RepID=UPI0002ACFAE7|nr:cobalt-precorrin-6A reductase [Gloeocapsa sp. PCC 73106]ELR96352.1 precorrin-6x reductase [Gloeocapsa sp. PCC 73106]